MKTEIGIIGGSGFYSLIENPKSMVVKTKYGDPSDEITVGVIEGKRVAFLPRHGTEHTFPPHKVPYRANIAAFEKLGVGRIIATGACGSLNKDYKPGDLVLLDQFMNMTHGRDDTFFDEKLVAHVSTAEPYCSEMREIASSVLKRLRFRYHDRGTIVVVNGPRYSTKAESRFFSGQGFDLINMTQYPESALAREKGMCYLGIGIVTDYDAGLTGKPDIKAVSSDEIARIFSENIGKTRELVISTIKALPKRRSCSCSRSMEGAVLTK